MPPHAPDTIGLLGFGRFARAFATLLDTAGIPSVAFDPAGSVGEPRLVASPHDVARRAHTILLCVPVPEIEGALREIAPSLTPDHFVMDAGSVKLAPAGAMQRVLGSRIPWCATHPLFGPQSLARGERPRRVVVCPNDNHPAAHSRASAFYESLGCEVREMSADAHDRLMAETHALAFFVAKGLMQIGAGESSDCVPPSFHAMMRTVDAVRADAGHLFNVISTRNPYAAAARRRLLDALADVHRQLDE